jgi:hypothetical protein
MMVFESPHQYTQTCTEQTGHGKEPESKRNRIDSRAQTDGH